MEGLVEVLGLHRIADPLVGGVVVEDGAKQRLFGFQVGRRVGGDRFERSQVEGGSKGHG